MSEEQSIKSGSDALYRKSAEYRIKKAIYRIREKKELLGITVVADRIKEFEESKHPLATDGRTLYYDPEYVMSLMDSEIRYETVHLILHVAYAHHLRLMDFHDERLAQVAMDLIINARLHKTDAFKSRFLEFPEDGFYLPEVDPEKHTFEWIYRQMQQGNMIPDNMPEEGDGDEDGEGSSMPWGGVIRSEGKSKQEVEEEYQRIEEVMAQAEFAERMLDRAIGDHTGGMIQEIRAVDQPTPPWGFLKEYLADVYNPDKTWARPNIMFHEHGYLPSRQKQLGTLHICIDTSGSMSAGDLGICLDNIHTICNEIGLTTIKLSQCDTRMQRNDEGEYWTEIDVASGIPPAIDARGRGGTSFNPVFELVEDDCEEVTCLIYMTDGEGSCNVPEPEFPVIWAVIGGDYWERHQTHEFGETVKIADDHIYEY
jgi:predicted metal-dependent peptidase